MAMLYMLSEVAYNEKFNNSVLPIMCFDIDGNSLDKYFPQFREDFKTDSDKYYVIVTEHYFKMMTLQQYLDENINSLTDNDINNIVFQIIYILAKLNITFSNFMHGNLNLNSFMVYIKNTLLPEVYEGNTNRNLCNLCN